MKKIGFVVICLLISSVGFSQNVKFADIVGKWYIISMEQDSAVIVDVDNPTRVIPYYQKVIGKEGQELTADDSLTISLTTALIAAQIQESYFEYKKNKSYTSFLNTGDEKEKSSGKWGFDEDTQEILLTAKGNKNPERSKVTLTNGVLQISKGAVILRFRQKPS